MIQKYNFGKIIIDNQSYCSDLIITPHKIIPDWRREKGHLLQLIDLNKINFENIKLVIIGKGKPGLMKIHKDVYDFFNNKQIKLKALPSHKAVKFYNNSDQKTTIALFHLTC